MRVLLVYKNLNNKIKRMIVVYNIIMIVLYKKNDDVCLASMLVWVKGNR